jgi:hypothetical protein
MAKRPNPGFRPRVQVFSFAWSVLVILAALFLQACGSSGSSGGGGGGGGGNPPPAPTSLTATAGNAQVSLSWSASSGATSYNVMRGTANGGPYLTISSPTTTSYSDTGLTNATTYYYVVTAANANGASGDSNQASATPAAAGTPVAVTVNVLTNRHAISSYVYGGAFPQDAAHITDSGLSVVRWGGNAASTYNWQLGTNNADNDYYFEDFAFSALNNSADSNSTQFITDVKAAGSNPLMTMVMLPWVAQTAETSTTQGGADNYHWSFSIAKYGAQCSFDQYNVDAGNGVESNCSTNITGNDPNDAYFPLLDTTNDTCPGGTTCVYREPWATALASAFGSGSCLIPYSSITSCHFYDMDNEIDIWGSTHRDIHPNPSGYDELSNIYQAQAGNLKTWDPQAVRFGPVSCCWWFYWNGANSNDKDAHGGVDFLPWWINQVYWQDQISGTRSLDIFDIHAYPDANTSGLSTAQMQALAVSIYRDYWDPTFISPSSSINQQYATYIEPSKTIPFRIPRMRAIANMIYPGTPLSITEWSAAFAGESDFSTALGDADAYGILGRERVFLASRWEAPVPTNPNYLALKLFTNYDGAHHGFGTMSVSDTNTGNPNLFSSYAALNSTGTAMTLLVLNKDPQNSANVTFTLTGFTPSSVTTYTLASTAPTVITASTSSAWSSTRNFAPYTATLLVISGSEAATPASEWDMNPDTTMVAAGGTVTLQPKITNGAANVTLGSTSSDSGITVTVTQGSVSTTQNGTITVVAGTTPGFYHYTVQGTDSGATQTQGGYVVVGNPAATFSTTGGGQTGTHGATLPQPLTVTLSPGSSGGTNTGASVLFSTDNGTLSNGTTSGPKVIAVTNSSGVASVTLTLGAAGTVNVTAEGQYGLGHPVANFTETSQ